MCVVCAAGPASAQVAWGPIFPAVAEPFPLAGAEALGLSATWTGVAGLVLEREGVRIAFDPFVSRPGLWATLFRRPAPDAGAVAAHLPRLDAVFVGHTHYDHALDLAPLAAASPRATLHGSRTTVELARRLGLPAARLHRVEDGLRVDVGPFTVEALRSAHGRVPLVGLVDRLELPERGLPATPFRYPRGEVFAWRVEVAGRAIHVQGSAGIDDHALARQAPADVLVACLAARAGTPRYLERLGERLRPRVLVPSHHDDFFRPLSEPPRPIRTLRWPAFGREAAALARAHGTRLWLPVRGVEAAW